MIDVRQSIFDNCSSLQILSDITKKWSDSNIVETIESLALQNSWTETFGLDKQCVLNNYNVFKSIALNLWRATRQIDYTISYIQVNILQFLNANSFGISDLRTLIANLKGFKYKLIQLSSDKTIQLLASSPSLKQFLKNYGISCEIHLTGETTRRYVLIRNTVNNLIYVQQQLNECVNWLEQLYFDLNKNKSNNSTVAKDTNPTTSSIEDLSRIFEHPIIKTNTKNLKTFFAKSLPQYIRDSLFTEIEIDNNNKQKFISSPNSENVFANLIDTKLKLLSVYKSLSDIKFHRYPDASRTYLGILETFKRAGLYELAKILEPYLSSNLISPRRIKLYETLARVRHRANLREFARLAEQYGLIINTLEYKVVSSQNDTNNPEIRIYETKWDTDVTARYLANLSVVIEQLNQLILNSEHYRDNKLLSRGVIPYMVISARDHRVEFTLILVYLLAKLLADYIRDFLSSNYDSLSVFNRKFELSIDAIKLETNIQMINEKQVRYVIVPYMLEQIIKLINYRTNQTISVVLPPLTRNQLVQNEYLRDILATLFFAQDKYAVELFNNWFRQILTFNSLKQARIDNSDIEKLHDLIEQYSDKLSVQSLRYYLALLEYLKQKKPLFVELFAKFFELAEEIGTELIYSNIPKEILYDRVLNLADNSAQVKIEEWLNALQNSNFGEQNRFNETNTSYAPFFFINLFEEPLEQWLQVYFEDYPNYGILAKVMRLIKQCNFESIDYKTDTTVNILGYTIAKIEQSLLRVNPYTNSSIYYKITQGIEYIYNLGNDELLEQLLKKVLPPEIELLTLPTLDLLTKDLIVEIKQPTIDYSYAKYEAFTTKLLEEIINKSDNFNRLKTFTSENEQQLINEQFIYSELSFKKDSEWFLNIETMPIDSRLQIDRFNSIGIINMARDLRESNEKTKLEIAYIVTSDQYEQDDSNFDYTKYLA